MRASNWGLSRAILAFLPERRTTSRREVVTEQKDPCALNHAEPWQGVLSASCFSPDTLILSQLLKCLERAPFRELANLVRHIQKACPLPHIRGQFLADLLKFLRILRRQHGQANASHQHRCRTPPLHQQKNRSAHRSCDRRPFPVVHFLSSTPLDQIVNQHRSRMFYTAAF